MIKDVSKLLSSNVSGAVLNYFIILSAIATLSASELGLFTSFIYLSAIGYVVFDLGLSHALIKKLSKRLTTFDILNTIKTKAKTYFILSLLFWVYSAVFFGYLFAFLLLINIWLCTLIKFLSTNAQILDKWKESSLMLFSTQFSRFLTTVILFLILYLLSQNNSVYLMLCSFTLGAFFSIVFIKASSEVKFAGDVRIGSLDITLDSKLLFWASLASIICMRSDVILISTFLDSEQAGLYAKVSSIFFAVPLILGSINTVFFRKLQSDTFSTQQLIRVTLLFLLLGIFSLLTLIFSYEFLLSNYYELPLQMQTLGLVLSAAYIGEFASGLWEILVLHRRAKYFLYIKLAQLFTFFFLHRYFNK